MKTRTLTVTLAAAALALLTPRHNAAQEPPSFELIYHSDTRGYYRPCG